MKLKVAFHRGRPGLSVEVLEQDDSIRRGCGDLFVGNKTRWTEPILMRSECWPAVNNHRLRVRGCYTTQDIGVQEKHECNPRESAGLSNKMAAMVIAFNNGDATSVEIKSPNA